MADEMDIKPIDPNNPDENNPLPQPQKPAGRTKSTPAEEGGAAYAALLQNAPGFPWQPIIDLRDEAPCFEAPYITGGDAGGLSDAQLVSGIYVNIPRSPRLWAGDQLKLRWGYNTFYTTIAPSKGRTGPRLIQYLNSEKLADYSNGVVEVSYEVVRRSRLVGISHPLQVTLLGESKGRYRSSRRTRAMRRRKPRL